MQYQSSYHAYPAKPKRGFVLRFLRALFLLLLALPFLTLGVLAVTSPSFREALVVVARGGLSPAVSFPGASRVDLLILGHDQDVDNHKRVLKTRGRSDMMMLTRLDFENRAADLLSIPRDTWVRLPGSRHYAKINAAHAIGGPRYAARAVAELVGIRPQYMLALDFHGFVRAIDAMGGIDVDVDRNMDYDDNWGDLHVHLKKGPQHLNGHQALGFVRFRHADRGAPDSDFKRAERQQRMLAAIKQKLKNPLTWVRLPYVCDALRPSLSTNLTFSQLLCLAAFAPRVPPANLRMLTLPSYSSGAVVYPNRTRMRAVLRKYFQVVIHE
jgi:polyisoprenyl-teichoic acid--peptidoglycan teichoic acid transferase